MTSTALLVMDVQQGIVERFGDDESYLSGLADAEAAARRAGIGIIYVTVAFRPPGRGRPHRRLDGQPDRG